jgi:seryl-tRNA synthetase
LALVGHLREDLEAIQDFSSQAHWADGRLNFPEHSLGPVKCLLSPTICFHHYAWLQNTTSCPDLSITALGKCFRYESGNLTGLERLWDFTMREIIWVGSADYVLGQRSRFLERTSALFDQWGLNYDIGSATDPFFIDDYSAQVLYQQAFDLKYEVTVPLPYRGKALAVASLNYHQDFFGRSLEITNRDGQPIHTGCLGFGLERLVLAFLTQYGLDGACWPRSVREGCQSLAQAA